jgi:hypothetical protein
MAAGSQGPNLHSLLAGLSSITAGPGLVEAALVEPLFAFADAATSRGKTIQDSPSGRQLRQLLQEEDLLLVLGAAVARQLDVLCVRLRAAVQAGTLLPFAPGQNLGLRHLCGALVYCCTGWVSMHSDSHRIGDIISEQLVTTGERVCVCGGGGGDVQHDVCTCC